VYAVIFADAINVKIRRARSPTGPIYLALGVTVDAERDILGLWAGEHGEGAKFWLRVLGRDQEPGRAGRVPAGLRRPRGPARCGERGLGDDDRANLHCPFAQEFVQICLKKGLGRGRQRLKPVYTAASEADALDRFAEFSGEWEKRYPAIIRLWENAWAEFVPFLAFDREIRTVICTTNAIESVGARLHPRRASPRPLPHRAGCPHVPLPGDHEAGPDRPRPPAVDQPGEGRPQRLRHRLRRQPYRGQEVTTKIKLHRRRIDRPPKRDTLV